MLFLRRVTLAVAAQFLFAFSFAVAAETPTVPDDLTEKLHRWIDTATDLPRAPSPAGIFFADTKDLAEPSEMASMIGGTPRGIYDPETKRITLVLPWSAEDPQDISVLLHELIHHRQEGKHYYCEAAKEQAAYGLQKAWLAERDLSLNVNWIAVVLASSCTARDIHP